jgi:hypothetical protein
MLSTSPSALRSSTIAKGAPSAGRRGSSPWADSSDTRSFEATLKGLALIAVVAPTRKFRPAARHAAGWWAG